MIELFVVAPLIIGGAYLISYLSNKAEREERLERLHMQELKAIDREVNRLGKDLYNMRDK